MIIERLGLEHFGKFQNKNIELAPGINVIYGTNESGKTTIHSFIKGMLYGIEKPRGREGKRGLYSRYVPWDTKGLYSGFMDITAEGRQYHIYRDFFKDTKTSVCVDFATGREFEILPGQIPFLPEQFNMPLYRNTSSVDQGEIETDAELTEQIQNYMANQKAAAEEEIDAGGALQWIKDRKKELLRADSGSHCSSLRQELKQLEEKEEQWECLNREFEKAEKEYKEGEKPLSEIAVEGVNDQQSVRLRRKKYGAIITSTALLAAATLLNFQGPVLSAAIAGGAGLIFLCGGIWLSRKLAAYGTELKRRNRDEWEQMEVVRKRQKESLIRLEKIRWEMQRIEEELSNKEELEIRLKERLVEWNGQQDNLKALALAEDIMEALAAEMKNEIGDKLNGSLSGILSFITDGQYENIYADGDLRLAAKRDNRLIPMDRLSKGTKDQFYMALRLTAEQILCGGRKMPLLLDDSFAWYDEERLERTMELLDREDRQVLMFTCHKREAETLSRKGIRFRYLVI